MRILIRRDNGNEYVWKEANYHDEGYWVNVDGSEIHVHESNIAAVDGHVKTNYVVCRSCGKLIENTPEAIMQHYTEMENSKDCAKCEHLSFSNVITVDRKLVDNGDGTFHVVDNYDSELYCRSNYYKKSMKDIDLAKECKLYACRRNGVRAPNDIFLRYPEVFNTSITVDVLTEKKLKLDGYKDNFFMYDMKSRGTIKACVNKCGIVECFQISSNGDRILFYYSEKYDKLFYSTGYRGRYEEGKPSWFRQNKYDEALEKIRALYKGAE